MRASRRGSVARGVAINLVATFALLLQSLLAMPASAVSRSDIAICAQQDGTQQDDTGGDHGRGHGHCCILACVACGVAYVASIAGIVVFPERSGSHIVLAPAAAIPASSPLELYFAARGPPTDL
jgi:hypothetical protein